MNLSKVLVRRVGPLEEQRFQQLMQEHHYLGALPKISETLWYIASFDDQWVALMSFSAAALKCSARDQWIGWSFRHQFDRLKLVTNNSRFLILPNCHFPNLASRILAACHKRLTADWRSIFGHPIVLLETFVDPQRFQGTIYKAANWIYVGDTKGFRRTRQGYSATADSPKMVFVKPLTSDAQALLSGPILDPAYRTRGPRIMLSALHMQSLPDFFCRYSRSAACTRTTPSIVHCVGNCRRRYPVWDARLSGHLGLGRRPWTKSPKTFPLPIRKQTLRRTEPVDHP